MTETVEMTLPETAITDSYTDVALISSPGFDEIAAKVLLERLMGAELGVHSFANSINMSSAVIDELDAAGVFVVDLGQNQYKNKGCGSATEVVVKDFNVQLSEGEAELVKIANLDNKSGVLNKYIDAISIPWVLRKLYEIEVYGLNPKDVVSRMSHVIHVWLKYKDKERDPLRETAGMMAEFPDLMEVFNEARKETGRNKGNHQFNNFTALRYMRDMWHLGIQADEIRERVTYWITAWQKVKTAIADGEKQFSSLTPEKFSVGSLRGIVLESGDAFLNRAALCTCDILVAKNPKTGHALIATHELSIDTLARNLNRREPELWFNVRGWAVNGGLRNRGTEPTNLTTGELVAMVEKFPPQEVKK